LEPVIVFSMDQDWVPDPILEWSLSLFNDYKIPVTVFSTHASPFLTKAVGPELEIGIHPDFFRNAEHEKHIRDLLKIYPRAKGVRSHGLFEYSGLLDIYKKAGLEWDSTPLHYLQPDIRPFSHPSGITRIPIFWEDDDYFSLKPDWKIDSLGLEKPGIKCFDFHPIHLCLNTEKPERYQKVKAMQFDEAVIKANTNPSENQGTLAFFHQLCHYVRSRNLRTALLGEIAKWV
jgi:hypothetical protein